MSEEFTRKPQERYSYAMRNSVASETVGSDLCAWLQTGPIRIATFGQTSSRDLILARDGSKIEKVFEGPTEPLIVHAAISNSRLRAGKIRRLTGVYRDLGGRGF